LPERIVVLGREERVVADLEFGFLVKILIWNLLVAERAGE